jgi:hypothetical protein
MTTPISNLSNWHDQPYIVSEKNEYIKSYQRAVTEEDLLPITEEGKEDYLDRIKE